jgi:hypothetical protein
MYSRLHRFIREAFPDSPTPRRPVTSHDCDECNEVDALLGDRVWSDVADDFPQYCHDAFPLLTPSAQVYYLPAYMLAALGPNANMQGISLESALQGEILSPEMFTLAQRAAIAEWLAVYWPLEGSETLPEGLARWAS